MRAALRSKVPVTKCHVPSQMSGEDAGDASSVPPGLRTANSTPPVPPTRRPYQTPVQATSAPLATMYPAAPEAPRTHASTVIDSGERPGFVRHDDVLRAGECQAVSRAAGNPRRVGAVGAGR